MNGLLDLLISPILKSMNLKNKQTNKLDGSEQSLVDTLKMAHSALSVSRPNMTFLEEFSAGTGIADLVFFRNEKTLLSRRSRKNIEALTSVRELELLSIFSEGSVLTEHDIRHRIGRSEQYVCNLLENLSQKKAIKKTKSGFINNMSIDSDRTFSQSIAIEAKVKDWKSGIKQALRYQEFAEYTYLAIYEENVNPCLERVSMFESLGVGLITVSKEGHIKEVIAPKLNENYDAIRHFLASERFFSIVDKTQKTFVVRNSLAR